MALVAEGMPCALCKKALLKSHERFGTWGVWLSPGHPLGRYCDSVMHWDCYADWPARREFARSYFDFWVSLEPTDPCWHRVLHTDSVFMTANPAVDATWVILSETGSRVEVKLREWSKWLERRGEGRHPVEVEALDRAKAVIRAVFPARGEVVAAVDLGRKRDLYEQLERERQQRAEAERAAQLATEEYNRRCRELSDVIAGRGITCPHCQVTGKNFRLAERPGHRSALICRSCGWALDPNALHPG